MTTKKNKIQLKCDCSFHQVVFNYWDAKDLIPGIKILSVLIYELLSEKGRKLKKPRLVGDVVLNTEEIEKLKEFLQ